MQIKVISVSEPVTKQGQKAAYSEYTVTYTSDGKKREKVLRSFEKVIYPVLLKAKEDDTYEIKLEKNGQFWNWIALLS